MAIGDSADIQPGDKWTSRDYEDPILAPLHETGKLPPFCETERHEGRKFIGVRVQVFVRETPSTIVHAFTSCMSCESRMRLASLVIVMDGEKRAFIGDADIT